MYVHLLGDSDLGLLPGDAVDTDADPLQLGIFGPCLALGSFRVSGEALCFRSFHWVAMRCVLLGAWARDGIKSHV